MMASRHARCSRLLDDTSEMFRARPTSSMMSSMTRSTILAWSHEGHGCQHDNVVSCVLKYIGPLHDREGSFNWDLLA